MKCIKIVVFGLDLKIVICNKNGTNRVKQNVRSESVIDRQSVGLGREANHEMTLLAL